MRYAELETVVRVGVDLAKHVIQVHAIDADGRVVTRRPLGRLQFVAWCGRLPQGCIVAMEACSGAHYWARELRSKGLDARLISAGFVTPYRMQGRFGKNDANDAAAVCEAASRPTMRFVPVKSVEQQSLMMLHRVRQGLQKDRTSCINRIRGLLAEFGIIFSRRPQALIEGLARLLRSDSLSPLALASLQGLTLQLAQLNEHLKACDGAIGIHCKDSPRAKAAAALHGVGPIGASALVAGVGDLTIFKNGAQFAAWLGLTPRQNSSGGTISLGRITKRGDDYLRSLLIQGARSAVLTASKRQDAISQWTVQLRNRVGWQKAAVALANKNARILWAMLSRGEGFDPDRSLAGRGPQRSLFGDTQSDPTTC